MKTTTHERRAWRTIRKLLIVAIVLVVVRPGTAGMLSVEALAVKDGPVRSLVRSVLRLAGRDEPEGQDLRADLEQALDLAGTAATLGDSAEGEIAREAPFRPLGDGASADREAAESPDDTGPGHRYVSPSNAALARAAGALRNVL